MPNKVIVISAHPDDETLGSGGTILKHKSKGDKVYWLIATCMKEEIGYGQEQISRRQKEIKLVAGMYGFDKVFELGIAATKVNEIPINQIIDKITEIFNEVAPDILYLPFRDDVHSDHRRIFEAAYSCTKTFRYPSIKKILMAETISETEFSPGLREAAFIPNYFVDVSEFFDKKLEIAKIYEGELGEHPFPRNIDNIKALATFRGAMAGCAYAESFMTLKEIF